MFDATSRPGKQIICVLGMHRSGTSLITRVLNLLGMYLGPPEHLMKPNQFNPKGFWELQPIVDLDDEILKRLGGSWHDPPLFPAGWEVSSRFADLRQQARALIQKDFATATCWGWKDPRTCLTLPFWKQLLPPLWYVICLRNPVDVAQSLPRTMPAALAHSMPLEKAMDLWHVYTKAALEHSAGQRRITLFYEDFIDYCRQDLDALYQFVGNREGETPESIASAVEDAIAHELHHHRTSPEDVVDEARLAFPAKALYTTLRLSVGLKVRSRPSSTEGQSQEVVNAFTRYSFEARENLHGFQSQLAQLREQVASQEGRFEQQQLQLAEETARAAELLTKVNAQGRQVEGLRQELAARDEELAARDMLVGRLEAAIAGLRQSFQEEVREQIKKLREDLADRDARILAPPPSGRADKKSITREQYGELIKRVRRLVATTAPVHAKIAVVSNGDSELLKLEGREGWHFPQMHDGTYSGFHPKDSAAALEELNRIRAKGAEFLLFPATALWWLEYYKDFAAHLAGSHRVVARDEQTCIIFALQGSSVGKPLPAPAQPHECGQLVRQMRGLIDSILPSGAKVLVVSNGDPDLLDLGRRKALEFPQDANGASSGAYPSDSAAAIAELKDLRQTGAHFLVVPKSAAGWLDRHPDFARYLEANYRAIVRQRHVCTIFDLNGR